MIEVKVPKDLSKIKTKIVFGLTKRQLVCFALAAVTAGPLYFLTKGFLGNDIAALLLVLTATPFFVFALYEKNGFPAEKMLKFMYLQKYYHSTWRDYESENKYEVLERDKEDKTELEATKAELHKLPKWKIGSILKLKYRIRELERYQARKTKKNKPKCTLGESLSFEKLYANGICKVRDGYYTKVIEFFDINYETLDSKDRRAILLSYARLLKSFDSSVSIQLFLFNQKLQPTYKDRRWYYELMQDPYIEIREEYEAMLKKQASQGGNCMAKRKCIIFGVEEKSYKKAKSRLEDLQKNILKGFERLGTDARVLDGTDRIEILHAFFCQDDPQKVRVSFDEMKERGDSPKDYISDSWLDFRESNSFESGNMLGKVFAIDLTAAKLSERFLPNLLNIDDNITVSLHLNNLPGTQALKLLKHALMDVQEMKITEQRKAVRSGYDMDIMPTDILTYEKDILSSIDDLNSSNTKIVQMTLLVTLCGETKKELQRLETMVRSEVQGANCELRELTFLQEQGLMACAPIGVNDTGIKRTLTTDCAAVLVPFSTQELRMDGEAFYYGINAISKNMILADRKKLRTPNGLILGTPGSGKSFSAKREILSCVLQTEDDIIICDPEGEYGPLAKALKGEVVILSAYSKAYLNPMDIDITGWDIDDILKVKSDFIITILDLIAGGSTGLENDEKGIIDSCIYEIYLSYFENPIPENMPILQDLYEALLKHPSEKAKRIADSMLLFVSGSQDFFNHRTTVDQKNRILVFDIKDLGTQLKKLGMLIVQDMVWNRVSQNRFSRTATRYYCDEFHLLLREKQTASYCVEMWKRFRKWGGIPTGLTQNVVDFLRSPEIEGIIGNSDFIYLLNQSSRDMDILAEKFGLSKRQLSYVTNAERGSGLILYDNVVVPFIDQYPTDTMTYHLMNTKPGEEGDYA